MLFAVSEKISDMHIAQSAITKLTLISDPRLFETFASMNSINGCPEDFATIDSSSKENDVHIPPLHKLLPRLLAQISVLSIAARCLRRIQGMLSTATSYRQLGI